MLYPMTNAQVGDYEASVQFARDLFMSFKQKNKDEGIGATQALWLHQRMRAWPLNFYGIDYTVDVINMGASGDIETACLSLLYGTPDDMSLPYHWLTQERLDWLTSKMKKHLGWP